MKLCRSSLVALVPLVFSVGPARADERLFTFSYQATTLPEGRVEFENWATYTPGASASEEDRIEFRHELEFGLTDWLQLDVYLADWSWTGPGSSNEFDYEDSAVVLKVNYLEPSTDGFGLGSYHEVKVGDEFLELENKLLLQKNLDRFVLVGNVTLEAEWEGADYDEASGEIQTSLGAAFEVTPKFFAGLEGLYEIPLPDWKNDGDAVAFAGPTLSYRFGGEHDWWITGSTVKQLTDVDGEPDWEARLILGFSF
jgi:hypothetical protein